MNPDSQPPAPDQRRFWIVALVLFCGQVGLIFLLGRTVPATGVRKDFPIVFRLSPRPVAQGDLPGLLATDPTVLVFPSPQGFSGGAWMAVVPQRIDLPDWTESPRWLRLDSSRLGKTFVDFVRHQEMGSFHIAEKGPPPPGTLELLPPVETARTQSVWQIEGALARRALLAPLQPRAWEQNDLLKKSAVEIAADPAGTVVSARLVSRSGRPEADQSAVLSAWALRFKPLAPGPETPALTWGSLVFQWRTLPLSATNNSTAKPQ